MSHDYSLLAPGPVNLHPEVRRILSLPMIHHRTPEFDQILARVLSGLKKIFQTREPVFIHTSTGSGGMESLIVNTLSPGDKVIAIISGKFGERWAKIAEAYGAQVISHKVPWGEAVNVYDIIKLLDQNPDTRAVLCQACETSTGVWHPIQELGSIISTHPRTLFLVDGITALGAIPLPMDNWKIDGLVGGSQKAFMLPTGMSFVAFSKKAWKYVEQAKCPRFYFDVRQEHKANLNGETLFSSAVPLIRALDWILADIEKNGFAQHFHTIHRRAEMTRFYVQQMGLKIYAKSPADSVTAIELPANIDGQKIRLHLEETFKITIMGGQDQAKGKIVRIGHMGFIEDKEMLRLFDCLGMSLHVFGPAQFTNEKIAKINTAMQKWQKEHP